MRMWCLPLMLTVPQGPSSCRGRYAQGPERRTVYVSHQMGTKLAVCRQTAHLVHRGWVVRFDQRPLRIQKLLDSLDRANHDHAAAQEAPPEQRAVLGVQLDNVCTRSRPRKTSAGTPRPTATQLWPFLTGEAASEPHVDDDFAPTGKRGRYSGAAARRFPPHQQHYANGGRHQGGRHNHAKFHSLGSRCRRL